MMYAIPVLMSCLCVGVFWFAGTQVHGGPGDQVVTKAQESPRIVRYRSDHYRDPFVPKSVVPSPVRSSSETQDVDRQTVKVMGTMSSARGRWALLEFEDGKRLIVVPGQVISADSIAVKRITEQGVTFSGTGAEARSQVERTYRLYQERDFGDPPSGGEF